MRKPWDEMTLEEKIGESVADVANTEYWDNQTRLYGQAVADRNRSWSQEALDALLEEKEFETRYRGLSLVKG